MPRELEHIGNKQNKIMVGTKAEFTKLQVRHAVVGEDSAAIGKVVEKIDKLPDSVSRIAEWIAPHNELAAAIKAFKSKYGQKHPKFIKAVEDAYLAPVNEVMEKTKEGARSFQEIPRAFHECAGFLDRVSAALAKAPLDDAALATALTELQGAGSTFTNGTMYASDLARHYNVEVLDKVAKAGAANKAFDAIGQKLTKIKKDQDYGADLSSVTAELIKMHDLAMSLAKAVTSARI